MITVLTEHKCEFITVDFILRLTSPRLIGVEATANCLRQQISGTVYPTFHTQDTDWGRLLGQTVVIYTPSYPRTQNRALP